MLCYIAAMFTHTHTHARTHARTHTHTHARTHTHTHTHTHAHTHGHTHTQYVINKTRINLLETITIISKFFSCNLGFQATQ